MKLGRAIFDLFSSVRFGITLLVLLFVYMSVGSAGILYPIHPNLLHPDAWVHAQMRQWPPFEMTEFEWFHWWPFDLLIGLISLTMIVTTLRRIPLRVINLGVWTIHTGILVLIAGSFIYFHFKVEGDSPVARRKVVLKLEGEEQSVELLAAPGTSAFIGSGANRMTVEVAEIDPAWTLRSGTDDGAGAYSVKLIVTDASKRFIRQLIANHPEYTEDLIFTSDQAQPMKRAVTETGNPIVEPRLTATLEYESQGYFYLRNDLAKSWALYLRPVGSLEWAMRPLNGVPLYNDRISSSDAIFESTGSVPLRANPLSVSVPSVSPDDPCPDVTFTIDGYLRYAQTKSRLIAGGASAPFNPAATINVGSADGAKATYQLVAFDPGRSTGDDGLIRMVAVKSDAEFDGLLGRAELRIAIPSIGVDAIEPVRLPQGKDESPFISIGNPEAGYGFRVIAAQDNLPVARRTASVLIIDIKTPTKVIRRWVFDDATLTRDVPSVADGHADPVAPDDSIRIEYRPGGGRALMTLAVGPDPDQLRIVTAFGESAGKSQGVTVGSPIALPAGLTVRVSWYEPRAILQTRPMIVPPEQRIQNAHEMFAQARVSIPGVESRWLEFSPYAYDDVRFAVRRHPFHPVRVTLADGREMELLFSRQRLPLGTEVALEEFILTSHVGGYTGESGTIRDYTSIVRFRDGEQWGSPLRVSVNEPIEHDGLWYFQAQWDPPEAPSGPGDRGSMGLNYTVLGVGNREGVWIQLAGCIIAVSGMIYAFYVKPLLIRRRNERARRSAEARIGSAPEMERA